MGRGQCGSPVMPAASPAVLTEDGQPCRFPFRHGGRLLHSCTSEGSAHRKWWVPAGPGLPSSPRVPGPFHPLLQGDRPSAGGASKRVDGGVRGAWSPESRPALTARHTPPTGVPRLTTTTGTGPGATVRRPPSPRGAQVGAWGWGGPSPGQVGAGPGQGMSLGHQGPRAGGGGATGTELTGERHARQEGCRGCAHYRPGAGGLRLSWGTRTPRTSTGASLRQQPRQRRAVRGAEPGGRLAGLSDLPPALLHVPSCSGPLCLRPLPQWRLLRPHPGPQGLPLHLHPGLRRPGLRHW